MVFKWKLSWIFWLWNWSNCRIDGGKCLTEFSSSGKATDVIIGLSFFRKDPKIAKNRINSYIFKRVRNKSLTPLSSH
jgi:hypothetical protein